MPSPLGRFGWSLTREIQSSIAFSFQLSLDSHLPEESGVPQPWVHSWVWLVTYQRNLEFHSLEFTVEFGQWLTRGIWSSKALSSQSSLASDLPVKSGVPQPWVHSWGPPPLCKHSGPVSPAETTPDGHNLEAPSQICHKNHGNDNYELDEAPRAEG